MFHLDKAYYYGTTIGKSWWRRYRGDGWLMRGAGEMWADDDGLHFNRHLARKVLTIPYEQIAGLESGRWHAGKWTGVPVLKVVWEKDGKSFISGFSLAKRKGEAEQYIGQIAERLGRNQK